jgi:acetoin utilization deacetylase AcuC-like enzyme
MKVRTAYSDNYFAETPQPSMRKLPLVAAVAQAKGYAELIAPTPVTRNELLTIHDRTYVDAILSGKGMLAQAAFGFWSEQYRDGVLAINGGQLLAAEMALEDGIAANVAQGFHHAHPDCGGGYCTFNGLALVAAHNPKLKVLVIDCDEHAGDGTAEFTNRLPNLYNFSVCGSGMGVKWQSKRSKVRILRTAGDTATYRKYLDEALDFACDLRPDLVIYQAGMDCHKNDPYAYAKLPTQFLGRRDAYVMESLALGMHIPFFFVLAGGYQEPMESTLIPLHLRTFQIASEVRTALVGD